MRNKLSHMVAERHYDATTAGGRKRSEKEHDETMIEQKERTKAYVQQAADARDYTSSCWRLNSGESMPASSR